MLRQLVEISGQHAEQIAFLLGCAIRVKEEGKGGDWARTYESDAPATFRSLAFNTAMLKVFLKPFGGW